MTVANDPTSQFFTRAGSLLAVLDAQGHFSQTNPAWNQWLATPSAALLQTPWLQCLAPAWREQGAQALQTARRNGSAQIELPLVRNQEAVCWQCDWDGVQQAYALTGIPQLRAAAPALSGLLATLCDNADLGIALSDAEHRFVYVNKALCELVGCRAEQLLGTTVTGLFPDYLHGQVLQAWREALLETQSSSHEWSAQHQEGFVFETACALYPVQQAGQTWVACLLSDISARLQNLRVLQENTSRLQLTIENLPIMVDALDEQGHFVLWNRECERITGYSADDILDNPYALNLLYPDASYREKVVSAVQHVLHTDPGYRRGEWVTHCKDGSRKIIAWSVNSAIKIPGFAVWGVGEDVTEREEALRRLRDSEEFLQNSMRRLSAVVDKLPIMVDALDEAGNIVLWNRECARVTGYSAEEILHNSQALELLYPDTQYRQRMLTAVGRVLTDPPGYRRGEWRVRCKDGSERIIAWMVNSEIQFPGYTVWGIGEDITEREMAHRQLLDNEQHLRLLVENLPLMLNAFDAQGRLVFWNRQSEKITGFSAEQIRQHPDPLALLYPQSQSRGFREQPLSTGFGKAWEMDIACSDGNYKRIRWSDVSQHLEVGGWARWLLGEEVTTRQPQVALDLLDGPLPAQLLTRLDLGVCITDWRQHLCYANPCFADSYGYTLEALRGAPLTQLIPPQSQSFVFRHYFSFLNGAHGDLYREVLEGLHANGERLRFALTALRMPQADGQYVVVWLVRPL